MTGVQTCALPISHGVTKVPRTNPGEPVPAGDGAEDETRGRPRDALAAYTVNLTQSAREGKLDVNAIELRTPARRMATADEMARIAMFLASRDAAFVNGQAIVADGGWTAQGGI